MTVGMVKGRGNGRDQSRRDTAQILRSNDEGSSKDMHLRLRVESTRASIRLVAAGYLIDTSRAFGLNRTSPGHGRQLGRGFSLRPG
jgi:hypothetical protein